MSETCCALIPLLLLRLRVPPMLYLFCGFAAQWSRRQESLAAGALPGDGELWADVPRDGPGLDEPKDGRGVTRLESQSDTLSCAVVVLSVASPLLAACASLVRPTTKCSLHTRSSQKSSLKLQSCVSQLVQPILTDRSTIVQITRSEFPECAGGDPPKMGNTSRRFSSVQNPLMDGPRVVHLMLSFSNTGCERWRTSCRTCWRVRGAYEDRAVQRAGRQELSWRPPCASTITTRNAQKRRSEKSKRGTCWWN